MNCFPHRILIFAASLLLAGTTALSAPVDTFARTQAHIDALLKRRLKPEPLPADLPNPFQLSGELGTKGPKGGEVASPADKPPPVDLPPGSDSELLARFISTLKISGAVVLNGQLHLVINQAPYKEGEAIPLGPKDALTYLQVIKITPSELTLGLNKAVQTIPVKVN